MVPDNVCLSLCKER